MKLSYFVLTSCVTLMPLALLADTAVPLPANSSTSNVTATGSWGKESGFQISWNIAQSGSLYNYTYSISNTQGKNLGGAHLQTFILALSPDVTSSNIATIIQSPNYTITGPQTFTQNSNFTGIPSGGIYGVAFNITGNPAKATISFVSSLAPAWGSFYTQGDSPQSTYAYNAGFGTQPGTGTSNFTPWIPTPDSAVTVPEPTTMLILGSSLGLAWYKRRQEA